jgi:hypothetical protein
MLRRDMSIARRVQSGQARLNGTTRTSGTRGTMRSTMPIGAPVYTDEQRDAIASAWNDRGVRPASRVVELAAAGELTRPDGSKLDAFAVPEGTVRSLARHARKRRRGDVASRLADETPRDAVENLRRRLVAVADHELQRLERAQRTKPRDAIDVEQLRQVSRAVLEISRLPGPTDPRTPSATTRDADGRKGPETRGGLAGPLLAAHRAGTLPAAPVQTGGSQAAHERQHTSNQDGEQEARSTTDAPVQTDTDDGDPGAWARKQGEAVLGAEHGAS